MSFVSDYQKHSVLYFVDGNVCLAAPKLNLTAASNSSSEAASPVQEAEKPAGPVGTLFRVHQTILSLHSPIFGDTFALPNPKGANETHEGVPLVQMPDNADDLEILLKAFYFGYELPYPRLNPNTPDAVRNILVMANKYQVDFVRKIIVDRLESDWPQTVSAWERLESEISTMGDQEEALEYVMPYPNPQLPSVSLETATSPPSSQQRSTTSHGSPSATTGTSCADLARAKSSFLSPTRDFVLFGGPC
ncbi:uncharacterized protein STEHIDRAFT_161204 [Stereum hirsutum FP-91666 SS1]|uniref:uncharacterized protein n=1 Tax=Stereum hirsutum (strain FP-91666) TaxID=721885 RepID=UPI0004449B13|nr:uncharacterized protein STEHIDRAFT_161204 [Stereum hirsutum FP-91666 SS1]EIM81852.1 hypothetical protein STEHIDRAFT_161204 [Stereum hirsutum FP-91666 SS1]